MATKAKEDKKYIRGLKALSDALKELGLPHSVKTLRSYEARGVIPSVKSPSGIRVYSEKDIEGIVRIVAGKQDGKTK